MKYWCKRLWLNLIRFIKLWLLLVAFVLVDSTSLFGALQAVSGWCEYGGQKVTIAGSLSTSLAQASYPGCQVDVYNSGTLTHASIFSNSGGTPLANPFIADATTGFWVFYINTGVYDVTLSNAGMPAPYTIPAVNIIAAPSGPGGATNSIQYNTGSGLGGVLNTSASKGYVVQTSSGAPTFQLVPIPGTDVNFLQNGSGAVNRTQQNKLQEIYSVTDYGADPTGAADSSSVINSLITYAQSTRGGAAVFVPCGTYKWNNTVTISSPLVSFIGENESCAQINYTGSASGLVLQISPFSTTPTGEIGNFTLNCTSSATNGILSGQTVGVWWHDLDVSGCTGASAAAIHLHNSGTLTTWTERNHFGPNVSTGGTGTNRNTIGLLLDADNTGDSFGYNDFEDLKFNVSTGQEGLRLASGFMYNLPQIDIVCNEDNNLSGTVGPICIHSQSNWDSNLLQLRGEYHNTGPGTGTPYRIKVDSGARFANLHGSNISVFAPGGGQVADNIIPGASSSPNITLVENSATTSFDTGTYTLNGVVTTPQPIQRGNYGSLGLLVGAGIESPYVSMFGGTGNAFLVGTVANTNNIGQMIPDLTVDTFGEGVFTGKVAVAPDGRISGGVSAGAIDGNVAVTLGGYTSTHRAGLTNLFLAGNNTSGGAQNENICLSDVNCSAGIGSTYGTNIAHAWAWAYTLDPVDFEWFEKAFQTQVPGQSVAQMLRGGSLALKGHLDQFASGDNIMGTCSTSSSTSCSWTYATPFTSIPRCSASPNFDVGSGVRYYVSNITISACTVTTSSATTGAFTLTVTGEPN